MKQRTKIFTGIAYFLLLAFVAQPVLACGSSPAVYIYNPEDINRYHPLVKEGSFFESQQSIFLNQWGAEYAYPYYRSLIGEELSAETKDQLEKLYAGSFFYDSASIPIKDAVERWQKARQSVIQESLSVATRQYEGWQFFTNCLSDAFIVAATTLEERKSVYNEQELQEWVKGQDEVFRYCGTGDAVGEMGEEQNSSVFLASVHDSSRDLLSLPQRIFWSLGEFFGKVFQGIANLFSKKSSDSTGPDFPEAGTLLAYDQQYQSAAKAFYQWDFNRAEQLFQDIANNPKQPWRPKANLVLGRIYIRQAHSVEEQQWGMEKPGEVQGEKRTYFAKAKTKFESMLSDRSLEEMHEGARSLLNYVNFRVDPATRLKDAEDAISHSNDPRKIVENLEDLAWLWYYGVVSEDLAFQGGDFVQWYYIWQNPEEKYLDVALQKYDETRSPAWLVASLKIMKPGHARESELAAAARGIPKDSPGYFTAQYYRLNIALQKADDTQAKHETEDILNFLEAKGDKIGYNYFADLRMSLSDELREALFFSGRKIAAYEYYDGWAATLSEEENSRVVIDKKAKRLLNELMPLKKWVEISSANDIYPVETAQQVRLVAFVRAILLNDFQSAETLAKLLIENDSSLEEDLGRFLKATRTEEKKFAAVFFMLKRPSLNLILDSRADEETLSAVNVTSYNRSWWCNFDPEENNPFNNSYFSSRSYDVKPLEKLLSSQEKLQGRSEAKEVGNITASNYLTKEAIIYAASHPQDSRVPEALHLAVFSARSPCHTDDETKQLSKEAFQLLHGNYPNSSWTEATPYWY